MTMFLVKPHPPEDIMNGACPVAEKYKYAWEPVALKILAYLVTKKFPDIKTAVWHLVQKDDSALLLDSIQKEKPELVVFSDSDILVNEINALAKRIKEIDPGIITLTGGKHSSTLRKGDTFPFRHINAAFRGGPDALLAYVERLRNKTENIPVPGLIQVDADGIVCGDNAFSGRSHLDKNALADFDHVAMRKIPVVNQRDEVYTTRHQVHHSIQEGTIRTSPVYSGEGCPHNCVFCQSPIEFDHGRKPLHGAPLAVAKEIEWLVKERGVNNFFFLEPNLDLDYLSGVYSALDSLGINHAAVSGFIRPADIVQCHRKNKLKALADKGLRVVSMGLDIPVDTGRDIYEKSFSYNDMMESLEICMEYGIIVLATALGDPAVSRDEFSNQLDVIKGLPLADMDIRLAIAIRNTEFFRRNKEYLLHNPETDRAWFDRQNYRYQTLQFPGKITPEETYPLVKDFYNSFYFDDDHLAYVREMLERHPDTLPFFRRQYQGLAGHDGHSLFTVQ